MVPISESLAMDRNGQHLPSPELRVQRPQLTIVCTSGMITASADASEDARPIEVGDIAALRVSLIGYGEVGGIFGAALAKAGVGMVTAFDVLIADASWAATARVRASNDGVALVSKTSEAVADAALVISAVTAGATASAAEQIASACHRG